MNPHRDTRDYKEQTTQCGPQKGCRWTLDGHVLPCCLKYAREDRVERDPRHPGWVPPASLPLVDTILVRITYA